MIDWDAYRAAYPTMTYAEVAAFHHQVWSAFPEQEYHSAALLARFFDGIPGPLRVVEVGGWRGEAAARTLAARPDVERWDNFEVCAEAVASPVTTDARYHPVAPDRWPWEMAVDGHEVAVLAHVIEHMSAAQLAQLVAWLAADGVQHVYVEAPLRDRPRSWRHSTSAHLLEIGWDGVIELFGGAGYVLRERHAYPPDRHVLWFGR